MKPPETCIELACFYNWKGNDGIIRTLVKKGAQINLEAAIENSESVNSLANGVKSFLIVDSRGVKSIDRNARNQFSTKGRETFVIAFAIIIASPLSRMIGNFFMGINRPAIPCKLFENEESAINWLNSLK